jgi:hypothetical protein
MLKYVLAIVAIGFPWTSIWAHAPDEPREQRDLRIPTEAVVGGEIVIPGAKAIRRIEATLYNSPLQLKRIDGFLIPEARHSDVISIFLESVVDSEIAPIVKEEGVLRIETKDGGVRHIIWYWTGGKTNLNFSVLGVRCEHVRAKWDGGDDALGLELLIRDIYKETTGEDTFQPMPKVP